MDTSSVTEYSRRCINRVCFQTSQVKIVSSLIYIYMYSDMIFYFFRNGTSMISLIIPPKDQISRVAKMLADEFGTASNIKSRVNRLSVLGAITSVQQRLKLYNKGLFCYQSQWLFFPACPYHALKITNSPRSSNLSLQYIFYD